MSLVGIAARDDDHPTDFWRRVLLEQQAAITSRKTACVAIPFANEYRELASSGSHAKFLRFRPVRLVESIEGEFVRERIKDP
jgi:hypothetical protein